MEHSEDMDQVGAALAAAAAELHDVQHDAKNPHLRNRYASLSAVLTTARPILARHGLTMTQWLSGQVRVSEGVAVTTMILHTSGQWIRSTVSAVVLEARGVSLAQSGGIQISYLRRYAAMAALGVSSTDDDLDGEIPGHGATAKKQARPAAPAKAPAPARWSDGERKAFCAALTGWGIDYNHMAKWLEDKGKPRPSVMTRDQRAKVLAWLEPMQSDARLAAVGLEP